MSSRIGLSDQKFLKNCFDQMGLPLSEYSFANCYLFREVHDYSREGNFLKGVARDGFSYHMPLSYPFDKESHTSYFPIPEAWLSEFSEETFRREALSSDSDYLFKREKMASYPGRSLAGQRNFVRQFLRAHTPVQLLFDKMACREVLFEWKQSKGESDDYEPCLEAIERLEELGLIGYFIASEGRPLGFMLAERLRSDMMVIHFAKGRPGIKGLYPYMYQDFCKNLPEEIVWINLEQDLGMSGLARAKASYLPDRLQKKYRLIRK